MAYAQNYYGNPYTPYGMSQPTQQPIQQNVNISQGQIRNVYSEEEARSAQIPIDGSIVVFTNTQNGRIYTKRFDYTNGSFPFEVYQKVLEQPRQNVQEYVTVSQFNERLAELEAMIPKKMVKDNDTNK